MTSFGTDPPLFSFGSICISPCFAHINRNRFNFVQNSKIFLILTDIIIQLDSKTATGSLTERDGDEKSSPRVWLSTVGEIKRLT